MLLRLESVVHVLAQWAHHCSLCMLYRLRPRRRYPHLHRALASNILTLSLCCMMQVFRVAEDIATFASTSVATVGPVGVGKSSLLNTVASYTGNAFTLQAAAGIGSRSLTPGLTSHTLIIKDKHAAWKWIDTAGDMFDVSLQSRCALHRSIIITGI